MRKSILAVSALIAAAMMLAGAGAGVGSATTSQIDPRDTAAVDAHLRGLGIDPATVVRQTGLLNYAGPNCPGAGWNCTTASRAVQVSQPGGTNTFEFTSDAQVVPLNGPSNDDCFVMQFEGRNKAHCKMRSSSDNATQAADIEQTGESNHAIVDFDINSKNGPEQDAIQTARVEQNGTGSRNDAHIKQTVKQSTSVGSAQSQEAHQVAIVDQEVEGSENFAHVHQSQDQRESGSATDQEQNTAVVLPAEVDDCSQEVFGKTAPNACAYIAQDALSAPEGGDHKSHLHQSINQDQTTKALFADQDQGESPGGIEGEIDPTNPPGLGTSQKTVQQDHRQRQSGPNGTSQEQIIDPNCCGFGTTVGGEKNTDNVHQKAIQSASEEDASQELLIQGATNHVQEPEEFEILSNGPSESRCKFTHHAANNGASVHFTFDPEFCNFEIFTSCANGPAADGDAFCTPPPEENGEFTSLAVVFPVASTPTFGFAIEPANLGEPAGFTDPLLSGS